MKQKRFLAKALALALAVTTVLPGAITANAAKVVTNTSVSQAETGTWSPELGKGNVGGIQMWNFQSGSNNRNNNSDFSATDGPAVTYASNWDVTYGDTSTKAISMDLYPNGTVSNMRFGILIKYIDPTHWAYINYDDQNSSNKWMLQYKADSGESYPGIPELSGVSLTNGEYTNVKVEYVSASTIRVTVTPNGGEAVSADLTNSVLEELETYAATAQDGGAAPIRFGLKGGTYSNQYTNINIRNVQKDDEEVIFSDCGWTWVRKGENDEPLAGQVMTDSDIVGGTNYAVVNGKEAETVSSISDLTDFEGGTVSAVLRSRTDTVKFALDAKYTAEGKVSVGYDGTQWYYTVGSTVTPVTGVDLAPVRNTDYTVNMTINDGKLTATAAAPAEEGAEAVPVTIVSEADVSSVAAGSIAVEAPQGSEVWVRDVSYTKVTKADPTELQAEYDRVKEAAGEENTDNKYYSDKWTTYKEKLDAVAEFLASDEEVAPADAAAKKTELTNAFNGLELVDKTALQSRYDELKDQEQGLYSDATWTEFDTARTNAKNVLDTIDAKGSVASTDVSGALSGLNTAYQALAERAATTEEKAELQMSYNEAAAVENKNYTEESWTAFTAAVQHAKDMLDSETATNTQVQTALTDLRAAKEGLTEKPATAEEKKALSDYYDSIKATANNNYTEASWKAYQDALKQVTDVLAKGDTATKNEVDAALANLKDAYGKLTANPNNNNDNNQEKVTAAFEKAAYTVDATASVETKVVTNATSAITYSSSDKAVATVDAKGVVTGVKAGKAVITAEVNGVKATTAVTVTTPKITLTAKRTQLQVKKSTKAIQVETKLDTDSVVSWNSSNTKVATVTNKGKVKAKKVGQTVLTVTMKSGATASCKLKVQKKKVVIKGIKVKSSKVTLAKGEKYTIGVKRNPITATEKITYKTNKNKVAVVSKKGVITAKAKGTCKITVKCKGKKKVVNVTVK